MKSLNLLMAAVLLLSLYSCNSDEPGQKTGQFQIFFDSKMGSSDITLREGGNTSYDFETAAGEAFNVSMLGYYISKIKLEGPNGEYYEDEVSISASASKGYYHVLEGESASQIIKLENVPAGKYNRVTFTIGVEEDGVQEGAAGGVLDPAAGAWFWNWNAGYIGFAIEGNAENSGQEYIDWGGGSVTHAGSFAIHIGGWKSVEGNANFMDNTRTVTLDLGSSVTVNGEMSPLAHVVVDVMKMLDGAGIDFSTTYSVHSPIFGAPFADEIPEIFEVHHVHQSSVGHD